MKPIHAFLCLLAMALAASAAAAQTRAQPTWHQPTYSDIYCAGFITDKPVETGLFVVSGEEGGLKQIHAVGDTIFLSRGAGNIVNPGGEYMLLRASTDPVPTEYFRGQHNMLKNLGTMYRELGRIKVNIVHDQSATAQILQSCEEIQAGDIAVPFKQKPNPKFQSAGFDRFAPPSGKNEGLIVTGRDFVNTLGAGQTVYLNIGSGNGVEAAQTYRIYRSYLSATKDTSRKYANYSPTHVAGERQSYHLNDQQKKSLPRDVIGELVILWVEGKSATAYITMANAEIYPGDQVEMK